MTSKDQYNKVLQIERILSKMENRRNKLLKLKEHYLDEYQKSSFDEVLNSYNENPLNELDWINLFNGNSSKEYLTRFPRESLQFNSLWVDPEQTALTLNFWETRPYYLEFYTLIWDNFNKYIKVDSKNYKKVSLYLNNIHGVLQWNNVENKDNYEFKINNRIVFRSDKLNDVFQHIQKEWAKTESF